MVTAKELYSGLARISTIFVSISHVSSQKIANLPSTFLQATVLLYICNTSREWVVRSKDISTHQPVNS